MQAQQSHQKKWEQYWKVEVKISAKKKIPCSCTMSHILIWHCSTFSFYVVCYCITSISLCIVTFLEGSQEPVVPFLEIVSLLVCRSHVSILVALALQSGDFSLCVGGGYYQCSEYGYNIQFLLHKKTRAQGKFNLIQDRNCCIILLQNITLHNLPDLIESNIPVCSGEMAWWGSGQSLKQDLKVEGHYYIPYALSSSYSELPGAAPSVGCVPNSWLPTPSTLLPLRSCCSQWVGHSVLSCQGKTANVALHTIYCLACVWGLWSSRSRWRWTLEPPPLGWAWDWLTARSVGE